MKLERGVIVAVEGIDGAGKTTQARAIAERLRKVDLTVRETKEPTSGPWGQMIRESKTRGRMNPRDELTAFIEDRKEHVREVLIPSIRKGHVAIVDRYYYSTAAYQGARGMDPVEIIRLNEEFAPRPDLLVLLDVPVQVGVERIRSRGDVADLFEREEDLERSARIFASLEGEHVLRLDGTRPPEEITQAVLDHLYEGPLFRALCLRRDQPVCEPAYCIFRVSGSCNYIKIGGPLVGHVARHSSKRRPAIRKETPKRLASASGLTLESRFSAASGMSKWAAKRFASRSINSW